MIASFDVSKTAQPIDHFLIERLTRSIGGLNRRRPICRDLAYRITTHEVRTEERGHRRARQFATDWQAKQVQDGGRGVYGSSLHMGARCGDLSGDSQQASARRRHASWFGQYDDDFGVRRRDDI